MDSSFIHRNLWHSVRMAKARMIYGAVCVFASLIGLVVIAFDPQGYNEAALYIIEGLTAVELLVVAGMVVLYRRSAARYAKWCNDFGSASLENGGGRNA